MKKEYFIWISGTDFNYITKFLDDLEYKLVKSIIGELDTQYEGCGIELLLNPDQIKDLSLKIYPEKTYSPDFNKCLQMVSTEYPEKGIFWQEYISSLVYNYIREENNNENKSI